MDGWSTAEDSWPKESNISQPTVVCLVPRRSSLTRENFRALPVTACNEAHRPWKVAPRLDIWSDSGVSSACYNPM